MYIQIFLWSYAISALFNTLIINYIFDPNDIDPYVEDDVEISEQIIKYKPFFIFIPLLNSICSLLFVFVFCVYVYTEIKCKFFDDFSD